MTQMKNASWQCSNWPALASRSQPDSWPLTFATPAAACSYRIHSSAHQYTLGRGVICLEIFLEMNPALVHQHGVPAGGPWNLGRFWSVLVFFVSAAWGRKTSQSHSKPLYLRSPQSVNNLQYAFLCTLEPIESSHGWFRLILLKDPPGNHRASRRRLFRINASCSKRRDDPNA